MDAGWNNPCHFFYNKQLEDDDCDKNAVSTKQQNSDRVTIFLVNFGLLVN